MRLISNILIISIIGLLNTSCDSKDKEQTLFVRLDSEETNVTFENTLSPSDSLNILDFEYMFNGGGVGIGDINNDGLQDIFFTGNQVSSKLYLNLGDFKFKDISKIAGVETQAWANGVSMVDINQDGLLDIYICIGGPRNTEKKQMKNLAFINKGDNTFIEKGVELGIADSGYSIQAVFFDYDKDGYTDLYLLTNALVSFNRNRSRPKKILGQARNTDHLYRNNGDGTFTDVSKQAGITIEGFGLGVGICDVNKDGWLDVYVSNDFLTNDILYVNNGNGTFTNQIDNYLKHQSYNGMGMNISDINNDGNIDIMVLDMLPQSNERIKKTVGYFSYDKFELDTKFGYSPQFVRNTLQLNNGNNSFSEIGQLLGIHNTDWSWSPLMADFDNDGWKDVFISNGYRRDVTNLDFIVYGQQASSFGTAEANRKDKLEKLKALPEVKLHNYIYKNNGDLSFTDKVKEWGISTPSYSNGAAYADLDNDGDLDLVINNIDDKAFLYKNTTISKDTLTTKKNHFLRVKLKGLQSNVGTEVIITTQQGKQHQFLAPVSGYLSTMEPIMHFGIGTAENIDSLQVTWPNGKRQTLKNIAIDQVLLLDRKNAEEDAISSKKINTPIFTEVTKELTINYRHKEDSYIDFNLQPTLLKMNSKLGPGIAVGDIDNDGLEDFYIGNVGDKGSFFMQQSNGSFIEKELIKGISIEDMGTLLLDIDLDGDLDLLAISGGDTKSDYTDKVYENDGNGNFNKRPFFKRHESGSCVKAADFDKDGDLDLFIGGRSIKGAYPLAPKSYLLLNENGKFVDATKKIMNSDGKFGMVTDALWTDFDNDQWIDLILVGEYMSPMFFKNNNGKLKDISSQTGLENVSGWWNSIVSGDFDSDGDIDYVIGNHGLNSTFKATALEPFTIYAKDFDSNGSIDPITTCFRQGEEQIIHPRDVINSQINALKNRFKTYESYAVTPFKKAFLKEELSDAYILKAEQLSSCYFENIGNGKFNIKTLPIEAQFAPIFGMEVQDFNNDNHLDILIVGNFYSTEVFTGQYDAMNGLCLLGNGKGQFKAVNPVESGLKIDGDAKGLVQIQSKNDVPIILASQNSGMLKAYLYKSKTKSIPIDNNDAFAIIYRKDGSNYKKEFSYGSSYLSHSSRLLRVNWKSVDSVALHSYTGQIKKIKMNNEN